MRTACLRVSARFRSKEISHELNELNELNSLNSFNSWLIFLSATLPQERPEAHSAESLCAIALRSRMTESPGRSTELCFADHRIWRIVALSALFQTCGKNIARGSELA